MKLGLICTRCGKVIGTIELFEDSTFYIVDVKVNLRNNPKIVCETCVKKEEKART
jgi:hypothetical protein